MGHKLKDYNETEEKHMLAADHFNDCNQHIIDQMKISNHLVRMFDHVGKLKQKVERPCQTNIIMSRYSKVDTLNIPIVDE